MPTYMRMYAWACMYEHVCMPVCMDAHMNAHIAHTSPCMSACAVYGLHGMRILALHIHVKTSNPTCRSPRTRCFVECNWTDGIGGRVWHRVLRTNISTRGSNCNPSRTSRSIHSIFCCLTAEMYKRRYRVLNNINYDTHNLDAPAVIEMLACTT